MKITILYDDVAETSGFKASHGFSCLVEGLERTILFDAGSEGKVLLANMKKAKVKPEAIEAVVISHNHFDHTGGLTSLCEVNPNLEIFILASFPPEFQRRAKLLCYRFQWVQLPMDICEGALSLGELGRTIREQSLLLKSDGNFVLVTGCAHPGIITILNRAREILPEVPELVLGGLHLLRYPKGEVKAVARKMKAMGVRRIAPCHCTGEEAIEVLRNEFGEGFIQVSAGVALDLS
jgi:7,8-dihydropterin-6-yl-methyl-4-(beta-D-ribofuranosyl)aminobenzene 5'-phosphate synthase